MNGCYRSTGARAHTHTHAYAHIPPPPLIHTHTETLFCSIYRQVSLFPRPFKKSQLLPDILISPFTTCTEHKSSVDIVKEHQSRRIISWITSKQSEVLFWGSSHHRANELLSLNYLNCCWNNWLVTYNLCFEFFFSSPTCQRVPRHMKIIKRL